MAHNGWTGVDLDGTLAHYDGWKGAEHIGEPIPAMLARVKGWLAEGRDVRIFTARVSHDGSPQRWADAQTAMHHIMQWSLKHIGGVLMVTNIKDYAMVELWDDRCVQVIPNTGEPVGESTRGLK